MGLLLIVPMLVKQLPEWVGYVYVLTIGAVFFNAFFGLANFKNFFFPILRMFGREVGELDPIAHMARFWAFCGGVFLGLLFSGITVAVIGE